MSAEASSAAPKNSSLFRNPAIIGIVALMGLVGAMGIMGVHELKVATATYESCDVVVPLSQSQLEVMSASELDKSSRVLRSGYCVSYPEAVLERQLSAIDQIVVDRFDNKNK